MAQTGVACVNSAPESLSPCVGICRLDTENYCLGCRRHRNEIAAWTMLGESERRRILSELAGRWTASQAALSTRLEPTLHPLHQPLSTLPLHAAPVIENAGRRRPAAVLVPVVLAPETGVLMIVRQGCLQHHPGQVAFPGGGVDPGDSGAAATALREVEEEIGLAADQVRVLGYLDRLETISGFRLTPVVGLIERLPKLTLAAAEVAAAFVVPFRTLLQPNAFALREHHCSGRRYFLPELYYRQWRIWGASAIILQQLCGCFTAAKLPVS